MTIQKLTAAQLVYGVRELSLKLGYQAQVRELAANLGYSVKFTRRLRDIGYHLGDSIRYAMYLDIPLKDLERISKLSPHEQLLTIQEYRK